MPVTELESLQGLYNHVEGKLAHQEELFSQSLQLLSQMAERPSKSLKMRCLEFIKENMLTE